MLSTLTHAFLNPNSVSVGRDSLARAALRSTDDLPASFDAREAWPSCPSIRDIYDQSACGDCWAVATVTAATDRLCIANNGTAASPQPRLSVEHMVGCCRVCGYGCGDGFPNYAWAWLAGQKGTPFGVVTGGAYDDYRFCSAYTLPPCSHYDNPPSSTLPSCEAGPPEPTPACPTACDSNSSYTTPFDRDVHRFRSAFAVAEDEAQIRAEIFANGPVTAGFNVYADWTRYTSGVYRASGGEMLGAHAVRIIGWGVEEGHNYWLVANSFGRRWGVSTSSRTGQPDAAARLSRGRCARRTRGTSRSRAAWGCAGSRSPSSLGCRSDRPEETGPSYATQVFGPWSVRRPRRGPLTAISHSPSLGAWAPDARERAAGAAGAVPPHIAANSPMPQCVLVCGDWRRL